jgi:small subunit ribosomal protein S3
VGQKTHPKAFRLVTTQNHLSKWYSNKFSYPDLIKEDYFLREEITKSFAQLLSLSKIEIDRTTQENHEGEYVGITIHALFPRAKEMLVKISNSFEDPEMPTFLKTAKGSLKKFATIILKREIRNLVRQFQLKTKRNYSIQIKFIQNPFEDAILIAKFIADQLEKRIPFRRAMKQTIKKVKRGSIKGIKIQISGRLNGVEMARSEWKRDGRVPLHTLRANIDYTHQCAETIYGTIGIKVWLFSGENKINKGE